MKCQFCDFSTGSMRGVLQHISVSHEEEQKEEFLLQHLDNKFEKSSGRTIQRSEFNEASEFTPQVYSQNFESYNEALRKIDVLPPSNPTRGECIIEMKNVYSIVEGSVTSRDMENHGIYSTTTYQREFGSWADALEACGFDTARKHLSAQELISEVEMAANSCEGNLTKEKFNEESSVSAQQVSKKVGWYEALREVGKEPSLYIPDREELIDEMKRLNRNISGSPRKEDMNENGKYSVEPYYSEFGSWIEALESSGIDHSIKYGVGKEEVVGHIEELKEKFGRPPSLHETDYSQSVYTRLFGSFNNAVREAGFRPRSRYSDNREFSSSDFGKNWTKIRSGILERDEYECRICGESENISVHHITPRSEFINGERDYEDMNNEENLITLCSTHHNEYEGQFIDSNHDEFESLVCDVS